VEVAHRHLEYERLNCGGSSFARMPNHAMSLHEWGTRHPDLDVGHLVRPDEAVSLDYVWANRRSVSIPKRCFSVSSTNVAETGSFLD
jgi:hypothetical protein